MSKRTIIHGSGDGWEGEDKPGFTPFTVAREPRPTYMHSAPDQIWTVYLPHQCDEWEIAAATSREEATALLRTFVKQAQVALAALENAPETDLA